MKGNHVLPMFTGSVPRPTTSGLVGTLLGIVGPNLPDVASISNRVLRLFAGLTVRSMGCHMRDAAFGTVSPGIWWTLSGNSVRVHPLRDAPHGSGEVDGKPEHPQTFGGAAGGGRRRCRRVRCNSPDVPPSKYWTCRQKDKLHSLAVARLESPMTRRLLTKITRAFWDAYSLHTLDSDDLAAEAMKRMLLETRRCLWPEHPRDPHKRRDPSMPPILRYRNPTTYIQHRVIDVLRAVSMDESNITFGALVNYDQTQRHILSDRVDMRCGMALDEPPSDALNGAADRRDPETVQAEFEAEEIGRQLDGPPGSRSRLPWRRPLPRPLGEMKSVHLAPGEVPEVKRRLRVWCRSLTAYERRLVWARFGRWIHGKRGDQMPIRSIREVALIVHKPKSTVARDLETALRKMLHRAIPGTV